MDSDIVRSWGDMSTKPVEFPETSTAFGDGSPWDDSKWCKFLSLYKRPLHWYAKRRFYANFQEAEDAFQDLVCAILECPEIARRPPEHSFRSVICQIYRNRLLELIRKRQRWYGRLVRAYRHQMDSLAGNRAAERRLQRCLLRVKESFLLDLDLDRAELYGITARDRRIWKSVRSDRIPQVDLARQLGMSTSAVNVAVKKVSDYHLAVAKALLSQ